VVEPDTGIITACALANASGEDSGVTAAGVALLATDTTIPTDASVQVLGDSAYGTGDMLAALDAAGHVALVKPWPVNPAVPGGFTVDDFTIDAETNTLTCPAGVTRPINPGRQVNFGVACRCCPCVRSAPAAPPVSPCGSVSTTHWPGPTAPEPATRTSSRPTDSTARWSSVPWPG